MVGLLCLCLGLFDCVDRCQNWGRTCNTFTELFVIQDPMTILRYLPNLDGFDRNIRGKNFCSCIDVAQIPVVAWLEITTDKCLSCFIFAYVYSKTQFSGLAWTFGKAFKSRWIFVTAIQVNKKVSSWSSFKVFISQQIWSDETQR
jgi:hypothetical protein